MRKKNDGKLFVYAALITLALILGGILSTGCSLSVGELPTFTISGPKDVDVHFGKPADIFADGRAKAQYDEDVSTEVRP